MYPTVIVKSYGSINPDELIKNIIKTSTSSDIINEQFLEIDSQRFKQYLCNIKTKYYQNIISLVPIEDMDDMPSELIKSAEAIIVYFNGDSMEFQQCIPKLCSIKEANNIELGLFLTDKLSDEKSKGLTYTNLKTMSKTSFDIIELCAVDEDSTSSEGGHEYNDVIEALHNNIWSNIKCPPKTIAGLSSNASKTPDKGDDDDEGGDDDADVESQLESFDELLNKMQQFKALSQNLNRDELLDQAEKLAELFDSLIYGD